MKTEPISEVAIDEGKLLIRPANRTFEDLYRAGAWGFRWDESTNTLTSPKPEEWSYGRWFEHILCVIATQYGAALDLDSKTKWTNVSDDVRRELERFTGSNWVEQLTRKSREESVEYGRKAQIEQTLSQAGRLWDAGCYSEYVEELSPHQDQLSPAQLKRLEIARKRISTI